MLKNAYCSKTSTCKSTKEAVTEKSWQTILKSVKICPELKADSSYDLSTGIWQRTLRKCKFFTVFFLFKRIE